MTARRNTSGSELRDVRLNWPGRKALAPLAPATRGAGPACTPLMTLPADTARPTTARLLCADAATGLDHLLATAGPGSVDLVFIDPPFGSEANYARRRSIASAGGRLDFELPAYNDVDGGDLAGYLELLLPVLQRCHALLSERGSLYLHLDWRRGPYARVLLDEIFGADALVNEIIWAYGLGGSTRRRLQRKHDLIYFYARDPARHYFDAPHEAATSSMLAGRPKIATDTWETDTTDDDATLLRDWPDELVRKTLSNRDPERTGYPTQKPLALLTRIVRASLPAGGLALDPMAGSGTLAVAVAALGGDSVSVDRSAVALAVARSRLSAAGADVHLDAIGDSEAPWRLWPGAAPCTWLVGSDGRCSAHLASLRLPWEDTSVRATAEVRSRLCALADVDGAELLDAWGIATADFGGRVTSVASWDGAAARDRGPVPRRLGVPAGGPDPNSMVWWACDVLGRLWRSPLRRG